MNCGIPIPTASESYQPFVSWQRACQVFFNRNGNEYGDFETRDRVISEAFKLYAYTQPEIATHLGLDRTTNSKIVSSIQLKNGTGCSTGWIPDHDMVVSGMTA